MDLGTRIWHPPQGQMTSSPTCQRRESLETSNALPNLWLSGLEIISRLAPVKLSGQTYFCSDTNSFWPDKYPLPRSSLYKSPSHPPPPPLPPAYRTSVFGKLLGPVHTCPYPGLRSPEWKIKMVDRQLVSLLLGESLETSNALPNLWLSGLEIISRLAPVKLSGQTYFCSDTNSFWPDKYPLPRSSLYKSPPPPLPGYRTSAFSKLLGPVHTCPYPGLRSPEWKIKMVDRQLVSLLLGLLSSLIACIQLHFTLLKSSSWLCEEATEHNKVAFRASVENRDCKTIKQKASYTTKILGQAGRTSAWWDNFVNQIVVPEEWRLRF